MTRVFVYTLSILLSFPVVGSWIELATATVNEVTAVDRSAGNGSATVFPYTFRILAKTDIEVLVDTTVKTVDVDYTVSGVGDSGGGNVTFITAPASGTVVTRLRKQPASQLSDYVPNEAFPADRMEKDLDKLTMQIQQMREQLKRGFFLPKSSALTDQGIDVPTVGAFARGKSGGGIDWATPTNAGALSSPVAVADGGTGATTASGARTNLGIGTLVEPLDTEFRVIDDGDNTKKLAFSAGGISAGNTRVITPPDANLTLPAVTAAGDIPVASASGVLSKVAVGSGGTILMARAADSLKVAYVAALNKYIYGFTYANNAGDATNDLDIAAGGAMDATGAYFMVGSALTKRSDATWVVGTAQGALDTGAVGDSDYYIWVIARSDTGVVDYLFSLSSTAPTMPASYDFKRLIGWFKRVGGAIVAFTTYETEGGGLEYLWSSPTLDIALLNTLTTTRRTDAIKVPLNFSTVASLNIMIDDPGSAHGWIYCPDQDDLAPSQTNAPLATFRQNTTGALMEFPLSVRTSATGEIAARASTTMDVYRVSTLGFKWARRN